MLSLALYYIRSIVPDNETKYRSNPSIFLYCLPTIVAEIIAMGIIFVLFVYYHLIYHLYISAIPFFVFMLILFILIIDIIDVIRRGIICDLTLWLQWDFINTSYEYGTNYAYFGEFCAYDLYEHYKNTQCPICKEEYNNEPLTTPKELLYCGHLYHKQCLEGHEYHYWNSNNPTNYIHPYCQCPLCREEYHSYHEKYEYDPYYKTVIISSLGQQFLENNIWSKQFEGFVERQHLKWKEFEQRRCCNNSFSFC